MIVKHIFRKQVKDILLDLMVQGTITPGVSMSLSKLAKDLGVSVTPVREALTQLTEIGIITYIPNRGFFVTELSQTEAKDIFETIAILESEAIKHSAFTKTQLATLKTLNNKLKQATNPLQKLKIDMQFHQLLIKNYSNQYLQKIIEDIRIRIFIYEHQFMSEQPIEHSVDLHDQMIIALEINQTSKAITLLKANWKLSSNTILQSYQSQQQ